MTISFDNANNFTVGLIPFSLAASDFDGDGNVDIVAVNDFDDTVFVLLGDDNGGLCPQATLAVGNGPGSIKGGDGNDVIDGGRGIDCLLGGDGADDFFWEW